MKSIVSLYGMVAIAGMAVAAPIHAEQPNKKAKPNEAMVTLSNADLKDLNCMATLGFGFMHAGKENKITDGDLRLAMASGYFMGKITGRNPDFDFESFMKGPHQKPDGLDDSEQASLLCFEEVKWMFPETSKMRQDYEKIKDESE